MIPFYTIFNPQEVIDNIENLAIIGKTKGSKKKLITENIYSIHTLKNESGEIIEMQGKQIIINAKDVKDEKTKAALESIYAYLSMKHDMKKEWMGRSKGRKPASRALKKPAKRAGAKRGASVPQRKRARFQSGD